MKDEEVKTEWDVRIAVFKMEHDAAMEELRKRKEESKLNNSQEI